MVALWILISLIIATVCVSTLGATFSVIGLSALFSGAALAVIAMATSLEFAKFVLSAYLHQKWKSLHLLYRSYLLFAIIVLSLITSMGIFGFLSDAYQSASSTLEAENIKLESLKTQQNRNSAEIARLNKNIDEIPAGRITKRLQARAEAEPLIAALTKQSEGLDNQIAQANLHILEVKRKVGPLIYISKIFNIDIDTVVKYLILTLVSVFDPLAICLVIATSESLESRRRSQMVSQQIASNAVEQTPRAPMTPESKGASMSSDHPSEEVMQMRFADDKDKNAV